MVMLLPSVLPCENAFRVSRSRTTTRSQAQRNTSNNLPSSTQATTSHNNNIAQAIGLGLSLKPTPSASASFSTDATSSCQALQQILAFDQTPKSHSKNAARHLSIPDTPLHPSRSLCTPSPETPVHKILPESARTPWTTPAVKAMPQESQETPRQNNYTYTCTIVTRNNKRKRSGDVIPAPNFHAAMNNRFVTPDPMQTPTVVPGAPRIEYDDEDDMLDDPFVTPKRSRVRGPNSKRICATHRDLGPWSEEDDKQLVGMVLAKMKLTERDWAECANTIGRDGMSVGARWRNLVEGGAVGLLGEKRKEDRRMEARKRLGGSGSGRLEPVRRGRGRGGRQGLRGGGRGPSR